MIEIYYKNNEIQKYKSIDEIDYLPDNIFSIRFIDFRNSDLELISEKFDLDLTSFSKKEDIEISSHYIDSPDQLSLNFTIPSYSSSDFFEEKDISILIKNEIVFTFLSPDIEDSLNQLTQSIYNFENTKVDTYHQLFIFQIGVISDYYADIVELISKKIRDLFQNTLKSKQFKENDLDYIAELRFNNLLIRESLSEFQRILLLLKKSYKNKNHTSIKISEELSDLRVIADYLQYNFNRLDDLHGNINSKIELEQNKIFKILTIITVCISLPTLIAGVYGMNFKYMPELEWDFGYPFTVLGLILSFIIPLVYFKRKKWF
ncbi:CorA family divalent cation transporter [Labilibaculum euxinus]|uniref:Magnesium and cobalt transport protein n=1 Tax=Labilibaculum euxinus TaxID=2686357 RepID=A0A7M4D8R4_9BACT|nr:CorA family divalent cation transporter [Labilibaculum euxinus]MUP39043.1 magnesium and cobalt transport protein [Labilibaculum euxinus]MVB08248.1 magnesium and cobalt transport protein [Labilibaculum euxinus]